VNFNQPAENKAFSGSKLHTNAVNLSAIEDCSHSQGQLVRVAFLNTLAPP
jgi:hypothetical protein